MTTETAITNFIPLERRVKECELMFTTIYKMMENEEDENTKKILLTHLIHFARTRSHRQILLEWLEKGVSIPGYVLQAVLHSFIIYSVIDKR